MRRWLLIGWTASLFAGGAFASEPDQPGVLATIERTKCFGSCPTYRVVVRTDGVVEWTGINHVKVLGTATWSLTPAELDSLRAAFANAHYLDLDPSAYYCTGWDAPSVITSFSDGVHRVTIRHNHYPGCTTPSNVEALTTLEAEIETITKTAEWVGARPERFDKAWLGPYQRRTLPW